MTNISSTCPNRIDLIIEYTRLAPYSNFQISALTYLN